MTLNMTCCDGHRAELETRVQELERRRIDDESRLQSEREKLDDRLAQARDAKDSAEKEALVLKSVPRFLRGYSCFVIMFVYL